jgi:SAM-dependent methyltransferase
VQITKAVMAEVSAYNQARQSGYYEKPAGLLGKYDNVRRFWEDEELGLYLSPFLRELVTRKKDRGERLRIMDIGCGSGDGYELITAINDNTVGLQQDRLKIISPEMIEIYTGIDINDTLMAQARSIYGDRKNMVFTCSDFNNYDFSHEMPYDIYLSDYGSFSHNEDEQTVEIISNIAKNGADGALIIIDWLGRYSYEWQTLWTHDLNSNKHMDYVISYFHGRDDSERLKLPSFRMRFLGREEIMSFYHSARRKAGGRLKLKRIFDRSSFVGRHIDTAQYNPHCQPVRCVINSLFELNTSTDFEKLLIRYVPEEGFDEVNSYYQDLADCWNYLVKYTGALLTENEMPVPPVKTPLPLRKALTTMKHVVRAAGRIKIGTPRTSLIEPQLGYCLRDLEAGIQRGLGCGHGIVAVFEVNH